MVRLCVCACACLCLCVCAPSGPFRELCSALTGAGGVSPRTLSHARGHYLFFSHTELRRASFCLMPPINGRGCEPIWNQYLATVSQSVWSPTSFSAPVGRKWPNTPAPVLRWTHCCHIKAQICTVAQLKFPSLPLLCTPSPTPFRTNGRAE